MASSGFKINNKKRKSFAGSSSGVADGVSPSPSEPKKREGGVPEKSEGSKKKKRKKSKKGTKKKNDGGGGGGKNDAKESGDGSDGKVDLTAEANAYVETWGKNRVSWKFNKKTQTYLLKKCYDPSVLPKVNFSIFQKFEKLSTFQKERKHNLSRNKHVHCKNKQNHQNRGQRRQKFNKTSTLCPSQPIMERDHTLM